MNNTLQMFINKTVIQEFKKNRIEKLINEEIHRILNERGHKTGEQGVNKTKSTKEIEVGNFYKDKMTNGAELARKICPKNWKDSTKRSYVSKLFGKNKSPRKPTEKDLEKGHNAID